MICALAAPGDPDLLTCPIVVIDAAGQVPYLLASSFIELVGLLPWGHGLLVALAEHVTKYDQRAKKGAMKTPQAKLAATVARARKTGDAALPRRFAAGATLIEDPIATVMRAREQHRSRLG